MGDNVEHGPLFASNVVSLAEFRERRPLASADEAQPAVFPVKPRPLSMRSIAHQARMLAHLTEMGNRVRPTDRH
jgi:hypothetical protein